MRHTYRRVIRFLILVLAGQFVLLFCWPHFPCYGSGDASEPFQKTPAADLIEIVLRDSSRWLPLLAHDKLQDGFDFIVKTKPETAADLPPNSNLQDELKAATFAASIQELLKRKDTGAELLARYRGMDPVVGNTAKPGKKRELEYKSHKRLCVMEIVLAQYDILDNLTKAHRRDVVKECLAKYQNGRLGKYEADHRAFTALLLGRVLQQEKYPPFMLKIQEDPDIVIFLVKGPQVSSMTTLNIILSQAQQFLSNKHR